MAIHQLKWQPEESAELWVLGDEAGPPAPARILEVAGKRVRLGSAAKVEGGAAVRLECAGQLVLGVVLDVETGGFWIEIHHMLLDTGGPDSQKQGWRG